MHKVNNLCFSFLDSLCPGKFLNPFSLIATVAIGSLGILAWILINRESKSLTHLKKVSRKLEEAPLSLKKVSDVTRRAYQKIKADYLEPKKFENLNSTYQELEALYLQLEGIDKEFEAACKKDFQQEDFWVEADYSIENEPPSIEKIHEEFKVNHLNLVSVLDQVLFFFKTDEDDLEISKKRLSILSNFNALHRKSSVLVETFKNSLDRFEDLNLEIEGSFEYRNIKAVSQRAMSCSILLKNKINEFIDELNAVKRFHSFVVGEIRITCKWN